MNISLDRQNLPTTVALGAAVLILLGSLIFAVIPKPSVVAQIQTLKKKAADAEFQGKKLRKATEEENQVSVGQTWAGSGNEIGPAAYANINQLAMARKVKVISFRPQRPINAGDVTQLPYVINVTGQYPNVLDFVRSIETTPTKLAVELLQLGATDDSTDNVTGTVGVEAYVLNAVASSSGATATSSSSKSAPAVETKSADVAKPGKGSPTTVISVTEKSSKEIKNGH